MQPQADGGGQMDALSLCSGWSRAAGKWLSCTRQDSRATQKLHIIIFPMEKDVNDRECD